MIPRPASSRQDSPPISLGVTGFAEFIVSGFRKTTLPPFKFNRHGEGLVRSNYYKPALSAIRKYHELGNNQQVLLDAELALRQQLETATERNKRTRCDSNIDAIDAYQRVYGARQFRVLPNHDLKYRVGGIVVNARPDLWVVENGVQVLVKFGVARKRPWFADIVLFVIRKAAIAGGYRIRARNVVYLDIRKGTERVCSDRLNRFNVTFSSAARQIKRFWPTLPEPAAQGAASGTVGQPTA